MKKVKVDEVTDQSPRDYEIEDAARTVERAHEIMGDKDLMKHVAKHAAKKIKSLKGLRAMAGEKALEEQEKIG